MNILIYYQNPYRTIFIESLVQSFIQKGHKVYFLTTCEKGILHEKMQEMGASIETYTPQTNKFFQYFKHWKFLIKYCRANKIDVIYSHLQFANLIAVLSQKFISAKVFPCRHHADDVMLRGNKNAIRMDKLVNKFSKKIIVVSNAVKNQLINHENVNKDKIEVITLGYNFNLYDKPDLTEVAKIREQMNCNVLIIIIGRMTINKRHIIALKVLNELVKAGLEIKMLILDNGPEEKNLKCYIEENHLTDKVLFTGFIDNTMNHLAAADLLVHPSVSEASNQVVKESGYLGKPSIVCENVGDFNEYILTGQTGFIVSQENTEHEMIQLIKEYYSKKNELKVIGEKMKHEVMSRFEINKVSEHYLALTVQ
jgi:glycosyltransferase involved in cell wall biosynthesis